MRQNQLDGIVSFIVVAEECSFSAAATRLGISPSAVSQSIRTLEQRLGATLFNRTTRSVSLTDAGKQFMERALPCVQELVSASEELGQSGETPTGLLRINIPRQRSPDFAPTHFAPLSRRLAGYSVGSDGRERAGGYRRPRLRCRNSFWRNGG
ncbi:DNA-binding transcriptional LysR family regulator [Ewingella americana]